MTDTITNLPTEAQRCRQEADKQYAHLIDQMGRVTFYGRTVPEHLRDGIARHVAYGGGTGHFLTAVFDNDLKGAYERGDETSLAGLRSIVMFLYNHTPAGCWGSAERAERWCEERRAWLRGEEEE